MIREEESGFSCFPHSRIQHSANGGSGDSIPQSDQKFRGPASHKIIIEKPDIQEVDVVADEMACRAIDGTEKENLD